MAVLSEQKIRDLTQKYFGDLGPQVVDLMTRIALAESSGDASAVGDNFKSGHQSETSKARYDYGLFQINSQHGFDAKRLTTDADYNAKAARQIYDSQGPTAWTTYRQVVNQPNQQGGGQVPPPDDNKDLSIWDILKGAIFGRDEGVVLPTPRQEPPAPTSPRSRGPVNDTIAALAQSGISLTEPQRLALVPYIEAQLAESPFNTPVTVASQIAVAWAATGKPFVQEDEQPRTVQEVVAQGGLIPIDGTRYLDPITRQIIDLGPGANSYEFLTDRSGQLYAVDRNDPQRRLPIGMQGQFGFPMNDPDVQQVTDERTGVTYNLNTRTGQTTPIGQFGFPSIDPERGFQEGIRQFDASLGEDARQFDVGQAQTNQRALLGEQGATLRNIQDLLGADYRTNLGEAGSTQRNIQDLLGADYRTNLGEAGATLRTGLQEAGANDRARLSASTAGFQSINQLAPQLGQLALQNAQFTTDLLRNPSDFLARVFFQRRGQSPLPTVSQADLINQLQQNIAQYNNVLSGFNTEGLNNPNFTGQPTTLDATGFNLTAPDYAAVTPQASGFNTTAPDYTAIQPQQVGFLNYLTGGGDPAAFPGGAPIPVPTSTSGGGGVPAPTAPYGATNPQPGSSLAQGATGGSYLAYPGSNASLDQWRAYIQSAGTGGINIGAGTGSNTSIYDQLVKEGLLQVVGRAPDGSIQYRTPNVSSQVPNMFTPVGSGFSTPDDSIGSAPTQATGSPALNLSPEQMSSTGGALRSDTQALDRTGGAFEFRIVNGDLKAIPRAAMGGFTQAPVFIVGDHPSGKPTGNEETVVNPTNAPIMVVPGDVERNARGTKAPRYALGTARSLDGGLSTLPVTSGGFTQQPGSLYEGPDLRGSALSPLPVESGSSGSFTPQLPSTGAAPSLGSPSIGFEPWLGGGSMGNERPALPEYKYAEPPAGFNRVQVPIGADYGLPEDVYRQIIKAAQPSYESIANPTLSLTPPTQIQPLPMPTPQLAEPAMRAPLIPQYSPEYKAQIAPLEAAKQAEMARRLEIARGGQQLSPLPQPNLDVGRFSDVARQRLIEMGLNPDQIQQSIQKTTNERGWIDTGVHDNPSVARGSIQPLPMPSPNAQGLQRLPVQSNATNALFSRGRPTLRDTLANINNFPEARRERIRAYLESQIGKGYNRLNRRAAARLRGLYQPPAQLNAGGVPRYADGTLVGFNAPQLPGVDTPTQEELVGMVRQFSPPAVDNLLNGQRSPELSFGFQLPTLSQFNQLTPSERQALNTRLGVEYNTDITDLEQGIRERFLPANSRGRAAFVA